MRPPSSPLYSVYSRILPRHPLPRPPHFSILLLPTIIISSSSEAEITRFAKSKQKRSWRTDQRTHPPTDGRMDGRTDRPSYRDAWTHLKTFQNEWTLFFNLSLRLLCFLDATKHLYKRVCPSVRPSVRPSVTPSLMEVFRSTYCRVSGLVVLFFL